MAQRTDFRTSRLSRQESLTIKRNNRQYRMRFIGLTQKDVTQYEWYTHPYYQQFFKFELSEIENINV